MGGIFSLLIGLLSLGRNVPRWVTLKQTLVVNDPGGVVLFRIQNGKQRAAYSRRIDIPKCNACVEAYDRAYPGGGSYDELRAEYKQLYAAKEAQNNPPAAKRRRLSAPPEPAALPALPPELPALPTELPESLPALPGSAEDLPADVMFWLTLFWATDGDVPELEDNQADHTLWLQTFWV